MIVIWATPPCKRRQGDGATFGFIFAHITLTTNTYHLNHYHRLQIILRLIYVAWTFTADVTNQLTMFG